MYNGLTDDSTEWSDSSYSLRRKYRLNWSAIIRDIPENLELNNKLEETFSKWSVSKGYSLPSLIEINEEMCIVKGIRKVIILNFPSRSSTKSFIKLSKINIWEEISRDSTCELYVYCAPPFSFKPLSTIESMNVSTNYWLIRGVSGEIGSEETFWDCIGRGNKFGEHLRRVVYIRDERKTATGFSNMGFCFLQFSSPLASYRALKWQIKQEMDKRFSKPMFIGTRHVQAMLMLVGKLDKYETKTLGKLKVMLESTRSENLSDDRLIESKQEVNEYVILRNYLRYWTRSHTYSIPVNKNIEFFTVGNDENVKVSFNNILNYCDPHFKVPGELKLYYSKHLNIYWDWNSRIFLHIQNRSVFEYDYELSSLVCISNTDIESKDSSYIAAKKNTGENNKDIVVLDDIERKNKNEENSFAISKEKIHNEKEKFVASLIETTKMQLSRTVGLGGGSVNYNNVVSLNTKKGENNFKEKNIESNKRKMSEFFDISNTDDNSDTGGTQNNDSDVKKINLKNKRVNSECEHYSMEGNLKSDNIKEQNYLNNSNLCNDNIEISRTADTKSSELFFEDQKIELEDLICFVCCRIFKSLKEKISHEQSSLLHKYNLENSEP
ncbi:hypothetical protein FG379_000566 [Cryptosporidium bovis]|uniref:uncharacterized protein n=1 Tax=Cryptosporidium bovis TaxID=310047 RepID=UPI00351A3A4D|nr:hypothetical protein FG379_000566 [Cryptosporidium bovis]